MVNDDGAEATSPRPPLVRSNTAPNKPKLTRRLTKRASEYLVRASDPTAAPRVVIQAKIIRGDYRQDVERMARAVVKLEKQRHIASKGAVRSEMRLSDVTCATWSPEDRQNALHQTFIAHLVDGVHLKILNMRKRYTKPTVVYGNDNVTTVRWQVPRRPSATQFAKGGTHTMHFADVVSIAPWTNALPPDFASKHKKLLQTPTESTPGSPSGFHAVLVVYTHAKKRSKQKQLLVQVNDSLDQSQLVSSTTKLVATAKKLRDVRATPVVATTSHADLSPLATPSTPPGESASFSSGNEGSNDHKSTPTDNQKADQGVATASPNATDLAVRDVVLNTPEDNSSADHPSDQSTGVHASGAAVSSGQGSPLRPQPSASKSASSSPIIESLQVQKTESSDSQGDSQIKDEVSPLKEPASSHAVTDYRVESSPPKDKQAKCGQDAKVDPTSDEPPSSTRQPLPVERSAPDLHAPAPIGEIVAQTSEVASEGAVETGLHAAPDEDSKKSAKIDDESEAVALGDIEVRVSTPTKPSTVALWDI